MKSSPRVQRRILRSFRWGKRLSAWPFPSIMLMMINTILAVFAYAMLSHALFIYRLYRYMMAWCRRCSIVHKNTTFWSSKPCACSIIDKNAVSSYGEMYCNIISTHRCKLAGRIPALISSSAFCTPSPAIMFLAQIPFFLYVCNRIPHVLSA